VVLRACPTSSGYTELVYQTNAYTHSSMAMWDHTYAHTHIYTQLHMLSLLLISFTVISTEGLVATCTAYHINLVVTWHVQYLVMISNYATYLSQCHTYEGNSCQREATRCQAILSIWGFPICKKSDLHSKFLTNVHNCILMVLYWLAYCRTSKL